MDITDFFGKASVDDDHAVATTVTATRAPGGTVLDAFDLSKFADDTPVFFVTYVKTTDPVTDVVSITNLVSWKALVNVGANTLTNLTLAPGYVDLGNDEGDFIECIPTSYWENSLIDGIQTSLTPQGEIRSDAPVDSPQASLANITPVGSVLDYAGAAAPTGWLLCYGQSLVRADYADLFAVLGTVYGSADGTHFNVPDLRGRVIAGQDDMGGSSANRLTNPGSVGGMDGDTLGNTGGQEAHVQTTAELATHAHTINGAVAHTNGSSYPSMTDDNSSPRTPSTATTGSSTAFNVVQPTIILNKIIKF